MVNPEDVERMFKARIDKYRDKVEDALNSCKKCEDIEIENAKMKNEIEDMMQDICSRLTSLLRTIDSV